MSANMKNMKMGHFGGSGGGGGGFSGSSNSTSTVTTVGKLQLSSNSSSASMAAGNSTAGGKSTSTSLSSSATTSGGGSSSSNAHNNTDPDVFLTSSGVIIPMIRTKEMPKQLPTIVAALQRPADGHLAAEDLDAVQLELELMLSNVALRSRVLKAEYDNLDKDEKRNDRRKLDRVPGSPPALLNGLLGIGGGGSGGCGGGGSSSSSGGGGGGSGGPGIGTNNTGSSGATTSTTTTANTKRKRDEPTGVRKKHSSMTIVKQQMGSGGGGGAAAATSSTSLKHAKNSPMAIHTDDSMDYIPNAINAATSLPPMMNLGILSHQRGDLQQQSQQISKIAVPKNDMPNKFWLSVEPYCMPLTNEDLRMLDDLLEQYRGPLVPPVPPLGPHYSTTWAQEDMKSLQPGGARVKSQNASGMLKKADTLMGETITGPLTHRLVSALIEETLLTLPSEQAAVGEHSNSTTTSSNENTHSSSAGSGTAAAAAAAAASGNFRSISMLKHCVGIEQRLKKELVDSGILDAADLPHEEVDEVMLEIKRVTSEISSVAQFNNDELKRLRAAASEEIKRIELKRKLDTVDQEILECYKRMLQYRAKRKGYTLEEKQEILRLTNEQRLLADQLERMQGHMPQLSLDGADTKL